MTRLAVALLVLVLPAAPLTVDAQPAKKIARIGFLWAGSAAGPAFAG